MKVSFIHSNIYADRSKYLSFSGFTPVKSDDGFKNYKFNYVFDENKDDCYLEVFRVLKDNFNNYYIPKVDNEYKPLGRIKLNPDMSIDLEEEFGIGDNSPFAYHYVLRDKNNHENQRVMVDAGEVLNAGYDKDGKSLFNIVSNTKSNLSRGGSMKLVIIDSQNVGYMYDKQNNIVYNSDIANRGMKGIKTLTNKFGGTLAGLEHDVREGKYDSYRRIISLPVFTDDDFSAHSYWNKNCMQMTSSLGNINNYASLQRAMFAHGVNFVSDGAFVNEGLQGVHFKHILKWGSDSPYVDWFKTPALKSGPLSMGIFVKNKEYISHKVVNSPYSYVENSSTHKVSIKHNRDYDKTKPTYIQFFDTRLVTDDEKNDTKHLIKTYSKMSTENVYALHDHNDSIFPYSFEIIPEHYNENIERLNSYNSALPNNKRISLKSPLAARIVSKMGYFQVDGKHESGFETWDANTDIAKLNYVYSPTETKSLKNLPESDRKAVIKKFLNANYQVQDYAVTSGQYWTQKTDDILRLTVAQQLKNIDIHNPRNIYHSIIEKSDGKVFPKVLKHQITLSEVENVLYDFYNHKRKVSNEDKKSQVLEGIMNTPLDAIEFGDNLVAVLASPLISKRAVVMDDIGKTRYELYKNGNINLLPKYKNTYDKTEKMFARELSDYAFKVLEEVEQKSDGKIKFFDGDLVTEFGKYVLPLVLPEITKYAIVSALAPKVEVNVNDGNGEISYDYNSLKQIHLQTLGITNPSSVYDEAEMVISKMRNGIKNLSVSADNKLVESIIKTYNGTSAESFKLADLIIDKNQAGLDWRIDATKDIANVDALRNGDSSFDYVWKNVTEFWKRFNHGIISKNPNAYLVAEITDEVYLHEKGSGKSSALYPNIYDILTKFQRETGMTATANYTYFFRNILKLFAKDHENGSKIDNFNDINWGLYTILSNGYFTSSSLDSLIYSYTFLGNHDKPRVLHYMSMDMDMFYTDLLNPSNFEKRKAAYKLIKDKFFEDISAEDINNYDFSAVSPKAAAMGYALRTAFINVLNQYKDNQKLSEDDFDEAFRAFSKSVSDLVQGKFLGERFNPEAFAMKPFDVSIEMLLKQAEQKYGLKFPKNLRNTFEKDVFKYVLEPAVTKLLACMKILVSLPGIPTLYDGDDMASTGFDTKTKNMYLQGRQMVHNEWTEVYKGFVDVYKKEFDKVMALRSRPEFDALNNGTPFLLPPQKIDGSDLVCPAILRQNTDGKMTLSLFNMSNIGDFNHENAYHPYPVKIGSLYLNFMKEDNKTNNNETIILMNGANNAPGISGLKNNMVFVNADDENDRYYVNEFDGKYVLKRGTDNGKITIYDTTLNLYYDPSNPNCSVESGNINKKTYTDTIAESYSIKPKVKSGRKLEIYR